MVHPQDLAVVHDDDMALADILLARLERGEGQRELLVAELVTSLSTHISAVDSVIAPALERHLPDGEQRAASIRHRSDRIGTGLSVLESTSGPVADNAVVALRSALDGDDGPARSLDALSSAVGDEEMLDLGREFVRAKRHAPTRPHAGANTAGTTISRIVGVIDRVRDASSGRSMLAATDGSGILDVESQAVVDALAELGPKPFELHEPEQARRQPTTIDAVNRVLESRGEDVLPVAVARVDDTTMPGSAVEGGADLPIRIYDAQPHGAALKPIVLYVHGGGWVTGDVFAFDSSPRAIALAIDAVVVSVAYRLAPEHPLPAAHVDIAAALAWLRDHAASIGGDPQRIAIVGEDAGANMAVIATIRLLRDGGQPPVGLVLVTPITTARLDFASCRTNADAKPLSTSVLRWALANAHPDPAVVAADIELLALTDDDLAGLPPTLVITAERDPLHDEGVAFAERLKGAGVTAAIREYSGVAHDFFGTARVTSAGRDAHAATATLLQSLFSEPVRTRP